jgi:hypothetical protein
VGLVGLEGLVGLVGLEGLEGLEGLPSHVLQCFGPLLLIITPHMVEESVVKPANWVGNTCEQQK